MSGLEATGIIKAKAGQKPQIIALTANATREDRKICLEAGMDDYLAKPIRRDRLAAVIEETYLRKNGISLAD
jgi:CheY-like chemotaxis protein